MLLHISELQYHYGEQISANRKSDLWFAQLGEAAFGSITAVTEFVLQTKSFITQQLKRRLRKGGAFTLAALEWLAARVTASSSCTAVTVLKTHTQHNFTSKLLHIISSNKGKDAFSSRNTTWPLKLRLAITNSWKAGGSIRLAI
ncbi:unnamed protein product [Colletotrichum noveboracense]|uniref:Uncharacterized protein n=1 Tax=Colletotrichum noveboracense TaxID=2664923 RepID=A0A9W4S7P8_9PEZI|nr:unnamed protein product [Colletotrichum noveboracense]